MNTSKYTIPVMIITIIIILSVLLLISKKIADIAQDISTNKQDISTNKQDISTNKQDISTNNSGTWSVKLTAPRGSGITTLNDGYICNYVRVDDTVSVSGRFDLATKNAPSVVKLAMSGLPIQAKAIVAQAQVDGFVNSTNANSYGLIRFAPVADSTATNPTSITMTLNNVPTSQTSSYFFSFTYEV